MAKSSESVKRRRDKLRAMGLRPIQIWVPDTRAPGFAAEYQRQMQNIIESDKTDPDAAFADAFIEENNREMFAELDRIERTARPSDDEAAQRN
jgi:hypothetical protein